MSIKLKFSAIISLELHSNQLFLRSKFEKEYRPKNNSSIYLGTG